MTSAIERERVVARHLLQEKMLRSIWYARVFRRNPRQLSWLQRRVNRSLGRHLGSSLAPQHGEVPRIAAADLATVDLNKIEHPIVIEAMERDSSIVRDWSFDFLRANHPNARVEMKDYLASGIASGELTLAEMIDRSRQNPKNGISASASFFGDNRDLFEYLDVAAIEDRSGLDFLRIEVFLGGLGSDFHCALGGNLFIQVAGEKRWTFVPPWYTHCMYPVFGDAPGPMTGMKSPILTEDYDEHRAEYPLYQFAPKYTARLEPGDALYNPPWWWHEVRNTGDAIGIPMRAFAVHVNYHPLNDLSLATMRYSRRGRQSVREVEQALSDVGDDKRLMLTDAVKMHKEGSLRWDQAPSRDR